MTCIAGFIGQDGAVHIGADSAGVGPNGELQLRDDAKVFRKGNFLIGASGSWIAIQLLKYAPDMRDISPNAIIDHKFMVNEFLPWLKKHMTEEALSTRPEFLVGVNSKLFHIYGVAQVAEVLEPYEACGSGAQIARGAFYVAHLVDTLSARQRVAVALEAAERYHRDVRGPMVILKTND